MNHWVIERYEPNDGTAYTMHFTKHIYGGWIVMVNDSSTWLLFPRDLEVRHLHGNNNEYTKKAIISYWHSRFEFGDNE